MGNPLSYDWLWLKHGFTELQYLDFFIRVFLVWANHAASTQGLLHRLSSSSSWPSDVRKTPPAAAVLACLLLIEMASSNTSCMALVTKMLERSICTPDVSVFMPGGPAIVRPHTVVDCPQHVSNASPYCWHTGTSANGM